MPIRGSPNGAAALVQLIRLRRWEEIAELACGLWLSASPSSPTITIRTIFASGIAFSARLFQP
jgi:hypothetical protein